VKILHNVDLVLHRVDEEAEVGAQQRQLDVHVDEPAAVQDPEDGEQDLRRPDKHRLHICMQC
jgi:hypothetical protein